MSRLAQRIAGLRAEGTSPAWYCFDALYRKITGSRIATHQRARIIGRRNIQVLGRLRVGVGIAFGFQTASDATLLNIRGKFFVNGDFTVGRGSRIDIGPAGQISVGSGYAAPFCRFVIMHGLEIGDHCAISWQCEILDEDFHKLGTGRPTGARITIGKHVWIGSGVKILKGASIADHSVVAANSLVVDRFDEPNVLIGGSPARILRREISWEL